MKPHFLLTKEAPKQKPFKHFVLNMKNVFVKKKFQSNDSENIYKIAKVKLDLI
jgi:hypothetical protein